MHKPQKLTKKLSFVAKNLETNRPKIPTDMEELTIDTRLKARPGSLMLGSADMERKNVVQTPDREIPRSHSVKKIVRKMTDKLKRTKSFHATAEEDELSELSEKLPSMCFCICDLSCRRPLSVLPLLIFFMFLTFSNLNLFEIFWIFNILKFCYFSLFLF